MLERFIRCAVDAGKLGIKILHEAAQLRKLTVNLASKQNHVRRNVEPPTRGQDLEHGRQRHYPAFPRLRLGQLDGDLSKMGEVAPSSVNERRSSTRSSMRYVGPLSP